ncbi:MAG: transposase [Flavobacteriales bacterium]
MPQPDPLSIFFDHLEGVGRYEGRLPHWRQPGKIYFVTWRLADSLAAAQLDEIKRARALYSNAPERKANVLMTPAEQRRHKRLFSERVQRWLDAGAGACELNDLRARSIVRDALKHFHGQRYALGSFALAGNHVHVLVIPSSGFELSSILHSWKSFTAHAINKALNRTGTLWRDEYYDHLVRDETALQAIENYILAHANKGAYVEERKLL